MKNKKELQFENEELKGLANHNIAMKKNLIKEKRELENELIVTNDVNKELRRQLKTLKQEPKALVTTVDGTIEEIGFMGMVSDRDTLDEALEYFLEIIKSMPKEDQFPVNMALQLILNTLSKNYIVIKKGGE